MNNDEKNIVILLLRIEPGHNIPLRFQSTDTLDSEDQQLLVGIVDPSQKKTSTPMASIRLQGNRKNIYNEILIKSKALGECYYKKNGYIENPTAFSKQKKKYVLDQIKEMGDKLYSLFNKNDNPLLKWLDLTLDSESNIRPSANHVNIITNDFSIPWAWFYKPIDGRFLCESCSLGIQQLEIKQVDGSKLSNVYSNGNELPTSTYRALLINGSTSLLFSQFELSKIANAIQKRTTRRGMDNWQIDQVESLNELHNLVGSYEDDKEMIDSFRIIHFSGHYSQNDLMINDNKINIKRHLEPIVKDSLLTLDGCSTSKDVTGWVDIGGITSRLINLGAVGCIATILPVKHDPILGDIFWSEFYTQIRRPSSSIGQALVNARIRLKIHLQKFQSEDPTWLLYQLIGSPSVKLFDHTMNNND